MINEESQPLDAEELKLLSDVKAEFGSRCNDEFVIRVVRSQRGQKLRLQKTLAEVKRILAWRASMDADHLLTKELENSKTYFDYWPAYLYGEDCEGHVLTVDRVADINVDGLFKTFTHIDDLLVHRAQYMERIQWEKEAISKREGRRVYKHICIVDLKGLGLRHLSRTNIGYLKPIFDVGQLYYPETLHRLYLINAPTVFYGFWKIISALIDPETRQKVEVFKDLSQFLAAAARHGIPMSAIPTYLDGQHQGRALNTTFTPSETEAPLPTAMNLEKTGATIMTPNASEATI